MIMIKGDDFSGFAHIQKRHNHYKRNYTPIGEQTFIPTSKFHSKSRSLPDCIELADLLYSPEHLNERRNKQPEVFEVYQGDYTFEKSNLCSSSL